MASERKGPIDDDLEREIAEALGSASVFDLEREGATRPTGPPHPAPGKPRAARPAPKAEPAPGHGFRSGVVTGVGRDDVFLEFGPREQGVVPREQFEAEPKVGESVRVFVESFDAKEGLHLCSVRRTVQSAEWDTLEPGSLLMGTVLAANKGGLDLKVGSLGAFLPASHASLERVENLETLIGQTFPVEVVEVDRERRRIVVSRRAILARQRDEKRQTAVKSLEPGSVVSGRVTKVEPFGAFVDLGGVEGLVHVSQMAWKRVEKPDEIVKAGDVVKVQVLEVSEDGRRIGLGMKQLLPDPWITTTAEHPPGSLVEGTVTRLAPYGAFVQIAEGVEGLAHISQLSPHDVRSAREVVKEGQKVTVRVVNVDLDQRRIGLSLLTEHGDRLTDDVADKATIREVLKRTRGDEDQPTLGDILLKALQSKKR
jgi:ribosomal protein S1